MDNDTHDDVAFGDVLVGGPINLCMTKNSQTAKRVSNIQGVILIMMKGKLLDEFGSS